MHPTIHTIRILSFSLLILFAGSLTTHSATSNDIKETPATAPFKIDATIMEIDLANNKMVIAEEDIHLLSTQSGDTKTWKTSFKDSKGRTIRVSAFGIQDRVLVEGIKSSAGNIQADSITMIKPYKAPAKKKSNSKLQLKDGTWVN